MPSRKSISALLAAAIAIVAFASMAAGTAGAGSVASASARSCNLTTFEQRHLGASYVTSLKVAGASCRKGKKVVKAFHECRNDAGGRNGKCHHKVKRYRCKEHRFDAVPQVQYNSRVKCRRGHKVIRHTYTQNV